MDGWKVNILEHPLYTLLFEENDSEAKVTTSRLFFSRMGFEFMSLKWFVSKEKTAVIDTRRLMDTAPKILITTENYEELSRMHESLSQIGQTKIQ